ncbi:MAG: DNA topoisomerase IB [Bacteroidota bacterium]
MKNEDIAILKSEARSMKLVYTSDSQPGYTRQKRGKNFIFFDSEGKRISDKEEIKRIKSLALPPAWINVWISSKPNGHLQATGVDVAGRKQYKYHSLWSFHRNERKHNRMGEFAKALPLIRQQIEADLGKREFPKEKVVALAVSILDKTFIRVGNSAYTKLYGSFGLTSLRNKHVQVTGNKMKISFKGKKGVFQEIVLSQGRLVRLLKKLKDIPGQELFQYYDTDGTKKGIDSGNINEYIEQCTGKNFTAKDFRTWWGTVTAAEYLADDSLNENVSAKKTIPEALDFVAKKLGNTRAVCKKYYVHPQLLKSYEEGKLGKYLLRIRKIRLEKNENIYKAAAEEVVMEFLSKECPVV